jgi:hypothetical protein
VAAGNRRKEMRRTGDDGDGDDTRGIEMATAPEGLKRGRSKRRPIFHFSLFSPLHRWPYLEVNTVEVSG